MEKEFVKYMEALALKELGFNEPCFGYYAGDILCTGRPQEICLDKDGNYKKTKTESYPIITTPTYSQAFRWFREKYGLDYEITYGGKKGEYNVFIKGYIYGNNGNNPSIFSYEEAELACLKKLIEIVKEK